MNNPDLGRLLDTARRRPLTAEEETRLHACFADDPSARTIWEEEMALNRLLDRLPDTPLSSNFTAQVLQAVERADAGQGTSGRTFRWLGLPRPVRQAAAACALLVLMGLAYWRYDSVRREKMALALAELASGMHTPSEAVALAPEELWENFDAIHRLPQTQPDEELLAVLKEVAMK